MSAVLGIDPGLSGGWAIIDSMGGKWLDGGRMPLREHRGKQIIDGYQLGEVCSMASHAVIEQVSAMPRQGVTSSFRFGMSYGAALALVMQENLPFETVTPSVWKKAFGLSSSKRASLDAAKSYWPSMCKWDVLANDGIAEAALIALWWIDKHK